MSWWIMSFSYCGVPRVAAPVFTSHSFAQRSTCVQEHCLRLLSHNICGAIANIKDGIFTLPGGTRIKIKDNLSFLPRDKILVIGTTTPVMGADRDRQSTADRDLVRMFPTVETRGAKKAFLPRFIFSWVKSGIKIKR